MNGNRLGRGKGCYDFTLRKLPLLTPKLIGLAYALQQIKQVPVDPWDIRLNSVITEQGFYEFYK